MIMREVSLITPPSFERYQQLTNIGSSMSEIYYWLEEQHLVRKGRGYERLNKSDYNILFLEHPLLGMPCARVKRMNKNELEAIKHKYGKIFTESLGNTDADWQTIWQEICKPQDTIRQLDIHRIPADAIAFYRPL